MKKPNGWGLSIVSRKWHYFDNDSFSLCGRIGFYYGDTYQVNDTSPDNCAECKRRKAKLDTQRKVMP